MYKSNNLFRRIVTGLFFSTGVYVFMSGEFILSSSLFCMAFISSNLDFKDSFRS